MPKIVDRDAMQAAIMQAAMTVYRRAGYHAAKMTDIAQEAGLAKGTLYLYFKSKEELTVALVAQYFAQTEAGLEAAPVPGNLDQFLQGVGKAMRLSDEYAESLRLFIEVFGPSFSTDVVRKNTGAFFDRIAARYAAQLSDFQRAGEVSAELEPDKLARALTAMLDGLLLHRSLFDLPNDRYEAMVDQAMVLFEAGLRR